MIYLQNHTYLQSIYIPKSFRGKGNAYKLVLESTIDRSKVELEVTDKGGTQNYLFDFHLPADTQVGEYYYNVYQDDKLLAQGVAEVIYSDAEIKSYKKDIEYEQYNG